MIRFSSIGDIVLTSPVIRALKTQLDGEVEIDFITKTTFVSILESNPNVSNVIGIDSSVKEVKALLEATHYDYVIDFHNNIRSRQVKQLVKALSFTIDKRNLAKWLYVQTKRLFLPIGHFTQRCFETVAALGVTDDQQGLDFFITEDQRVSLNILPTAFHNGFVAYAIGGLEKGKVLPTEKIIALCKKIDAPVVLLGGPEDQRTGDVIVHAMGAQVYNACGSFTLAKSASLMAQSKCVVTHDTGLMHIAAALKKKVISLWFATTPELGFAPWKPGEGSVMIEADCPRRPTSKLGNRGYRDGCVFNIDLDEVVQHI